MPWRRWREIGIGMMRLPPAAFWNMSYGDWIAALEGFREFHAGGGMPAPMTRVELDDLMRRYPDQK